MSALTRRTYDTDSIVLRRIFAVNPLTNQQFSTGSILATSTTGAAFFIDGSTYFASLGLPTSASFPSTVAGLGTAGYISSGGGGSGDITTANLVSTVIGLGTVGYISSPGGGGGISGSQMASTVTGLGTINYVSTLTLASTVGGGLASTIAGFGNVNVTQLIAGTNITLSPTNGLGQVTINASGGGGGILDTQLTSTTQGLGTLSYVSTAMLMSTVGDGLASTITGLSNVAVTQLIAGAGINLVPTNGLGQVTIVNVGGGGGGISDAQLTSTTRGLGSLGYVSTFGLIAAMTSLGSLGYVSTQTLGSNISSFSTSLARTTMDVRNINASSINAISATTIALQISTLLFADTFPVLDRFYASTNYVTSTTNMFMQDRPVGSYNPVKVVVSTVASSAGCNDIYVAEKDIGKYFLITASDYSPIVQLPTTNTSLDGWNIVVRNMPASAFNLTVNSGIIAPGVTVTVLSDGTSFYNL